MMPMKSKSHIRTSICVVLLFTASTASARAAGSESEFKSAYARAEAAEKEAGALRNRWTVTEAALLDARKAAERNDFDKAIASAKEAEALARASIFQATSEKEAWKNLEIR